MARDLRHHGQRKSHLLQSLEKQGAQVLDLEALAAHKGSVLGHLPEQAQPSQKMFESQIWECMRRFDHTRPVFVESESKKVGNLRVPEEIINGMRGSPCITLELSLEQRIGLLMRDYAHFVAAPEALNVQLDCLVSLHGKEKIHAWKQLALAGRMEELVGILLEKHYDPTYIRSINKNFSQMGEASLITQEGITEADFSRTASVLLAG